MEPEKLTEGQYYYQVTYPENTLTRPIIGSFEYKGIEEVEFDYQDKKRETYYIFQHHPTYRHETFEENRIAYTPEQVRQLSSIDWLRQELEEIMERQAAEEKRHFGTRRGGPGA